ncbi:hypothetical protein RND81_12G114700 [Saponaria officinalis]|uniref:CBF1-interacting co-repressor CIR N-terminal domain-containing protein n=1 Tax=Saponaria officinalis TaxID=3572 RepID=A0AAW1H9E7_SAPOF
MGMKFLNKKGWHTGSLQNIERVWKAEQKDEEEKRKSAELLKQIHEERERDEFRQLQEQAGFAPRQERLEFLYDSGLSVGKSSNEGFSALPSYPPAAQTTNSASAPPSSSNSAAPGALFEEKPQSANDAWRKLHSDPLLMIRQREQEALAQIKNNPVKMAMIRKSLEAKKKDDEDHDGKQKKVKKSKHKKHSSSKHQSDTEKDSDEDKVRKRKANGKANGYVDSDEDRERRHSHSHKDHGSEKRRRGSPVERKPDEKKGRECVDIDEDSRERTKHHRHSRGEYGSEKNQGSPVKQNADGSGDRERSRRDNEKLRHEKYTSDSRDEKLSRKTVDTDRSFQTIDTKHSALPPKPESHRRRGRAPQLSEEERAARLREMQMDAELHEENRWKRLKKAEEDDAREASKATVFRGKSFLDDVHKSVYGAEKGGSSTIEESVRRRSHFSQRAGGSEHNAFQR